LLSFIHFLHKRYNKPEHLTVIKKLFTDVLFHWKKEFRNKTL
jgi:hypothetical protein